MTAGQFAHAPPARAELRPVDAYRWALDPVLDFGSLLTTVRELCEISPATSDGETGTPALNLYLAVCALDQILSDYLHRGFYDFSRPAVGGAVRGGLRAATHIQQGVRAQIGSVVERDLVALEEQLCQLERSLGRAVLEGDLTPGRGVARTIATLSEVRYPRRLLASVAKIPQSFRGVDLYPHDCELLAERAMNVTGTSPVAVVGLRSSGMYMAGLCAAALDRSLRSGIELMSLRPRVPLLVREKARLRRVAAAGGWAFIVDDPPWFGSAFERAVRTVEHAGFDPDRVLIAACEIGNQPAFGPGGPSVWSGFATARKVVLRSDEWTIHTLLAEETAERFLNRPDVLARWGAVGVRVLRGLPFSQTGEPPPEAGVQVQRRARRFHVQKLFEVEVTAPTGVRTAETVLGRGVGLGYFGYHSYLATQAVESLTPLVLGIQDGVMFRRWEPGTRVTRDGLSRSDVDAIARYVTRRIDATRHEPRPVPLPREDRSAYTGARLVGRALTRAAGRVGALAQFRAADAMARDLRPPFHVAPDARLGADEWVRREGGDLVKVDFEEHAADITDRRIVDPLHDLAAAVVVLGLDRATETGLLDAYTAATGDRDRLKPRFTYQKLTAAFIELDAFLAHAHDGTRRGLEAFVRDMNRINEQMTRIVNGYLTDVFVSGRDSRGTGDLWAIDLDDTLETEWLGFSATNPDGARALGELAAHDQLVLVSSGRSVGEVRERCETFGLAGGIAEYGSIAWDAWHRRAVPVTDDEIVEKLETARIAIVEETDLMVDPRYARTLRVFRQTPAGRRGVGARDIEALIEKRHIEGLAVVEGFTKTVVWAAGTDKARALAPLLESLGVERTGRRLHVVGDSSTDLGIMRLADRRHAPANAGLAVRQQASDLSIRLARRGWGEGVLEMVERELDHRRPCSVYRPRQTDPGDDALLELLALPYRSRLKRLRYALHPASLRAFEL